MTIFNSSFPRDGMLLLWVSGWNRYFLTWKYKIKSLNSDEMYVKSNYYIYSIFFFHRQIIFVRKHIWSTQLVSMKHVNIFMLKPPGWSSEYHWLTQYNWKIVERAMTHSSLYARISKFWLLVVFDLFNTLQLT
jgi:hypothetical protein